MDIHAKLAHIKLLGDCNLGEAIREPFMYTLFTFQQLDELSEVLLILSTHFMQISSLSYLLLVDRLHDFFIAAR